MHALNSTLSIAARTHDLARAGALIAAEIDRLARLASDE
jgi:hypothetical protein